MLSGKYIFINIQYYFFPDEPNPSLPLIDSMKLSTTLNLLSKVKDIDPKIFTKSGIMVGLGEDKSEVFQVMDDMRSASIDFLTIGQYLQPSVKHFPLDRYYTPQEFEELGAIAKAKGFLLVSSSPLTRSSYHADEDFAKLQQNRNNFH
mgnify:CR=1 FL=1